MIEDVHLKRVEMVTEGLNILSHELREKIAARTPGGVDWYREVLRRLEDMHLTLHPRA